MHAYCRYLTSKLFCKRSRERATDLEFGNLENKYPIPCYW